MTETDISRRHKILIAAAAVAVLGPRARVTGITPVRKAQTRPAPARATVIPRARPKVQVRIRTARRKNNHETPHLA
jgi:hypothetical protein